MPYTHTQGFKIGQDIKIFMPIYEGNLHELIKQYRFKGSEAGRLRLDELKVVPEVVRIITDKMLSQILDALNFVYTYNPLIIHRDIKFVNIFYHGDKFLLTDFGIAKIVDTSRTIVGIAVTRCQKLIYKVSTRPL